MNSWSPNRLACLILQFKKKQYDHTSEKESNTIIFMVVLLKNIGGFMAGIGGEVHERVNYQKNNKKKSRAKTRKGGWQTLGFKSYHQYLIAKKNAQLDQEEEIQEEDTLIEDKS